MLGGALVALAQGIIVFVICLIAGFRITASPYVLLAIVFMFLISLLFAGIGTVFGSVLQDMQGFPLIINFLIMPIFFSPARSFPATGCRKCCRSGYG